MVMETPSPQCVGREFVRQYYTLLHEAPLHLHRFYSNNSSFVHGGVEKPGEEQPPVTGQADIHKKIMSLNFRDCHAKIRQVDSQATVTDAVVVQVTGELSNNGQPMRRFMQTFVLAPQSPKKYYVHNDIFRYQDEVFHDNDPDTENQEEAGDELALCDQYPIDLESETPESSPQQDVVIVQDSMVSPFYETQAVLSNGTAHSEERCESPGEKSVGDDDDPYEDAADLDVNEVTLPKPEEQDEDPFVEAKEEAPSPEPEPEPKAVHPESFSWAGIASKNATSSVIHAPSNLGQVMAKQPASRVEPRPEPLAPTQKPRPQRIIRDRERVSLGRDEDLDSNSGRRGSRFPDSHQLFVGNLPQSITEKELKNFFEQYGRVMELRINTKGLAKLPNFGFVVFDSPDPVQLILGQKPIMYQGEHRLNVEEKKPRDDRSRPGSGKSLGRGGPIGGMSRGGPMGGGLGRSSLRTGPGGVGPPSARLDNRGTGPGGGSRGGGPMGGPPRR